MTEAQLAELSRLLYAPVTLLLYAASAFFYLYALTTRVGRQEDGDQRGRRARGLGLVLATAGIGAHLAHEIVRGMAAGRFPLGNMFEFTSLMALVGVAAGVVYLQFIRRRAELLGFVMLGGVLVLGSALLVYAEPGPLMPILDTWWRTFHVSVIVSAAGVFTVGFVFNALHLLRDTAERRVAAQQTSRTTGSTVGAAYAGDVQDREASREAERESDDLLDTVPDRDAVDEDRAVADRHDAAYRTALRAAISPLRLAIGTFLGTSAVAWVFIATPTTTLAEGVQRFVAVNAAMIAAALIARWFVPFLPPAATLDGLAYRTIALGFPLWTFGVIAGAMWAEVSWGRFWGWDPKETASFLTWVAYAAYLHARATRGTRGRGAGWIGIGAFGVLMFTYYAVNLVVTGLHSYAGL